MSLHLRSLFVFSLLSMLYFGCRSGQTKEEVVSYLGIQGETMGTYYKVTYEGTNPRVVQKKIDSLLIAINNEVSSYEENSFISKVNRAPGGTRFDSLPPHFAANFQVADFWSGLSSGYFDPGVMALTNYWGFGYTPKRPVTEVDSLVIDSLKQFTGMAKWVIDTAGIIKQFDQQQLDFGALAKGYAVDQVAALLKDLGSQNFLVDIGGELVAKGINDKGNVWVIGISTPREDAPMNDVQLLIQLDDMALATSGNYRNYHVVDDRKYGHTLNPITGFPYQDELLSVTIISDECIDADAIATACMAMGYAKAITFMDLIPKISACFLVGEEDGTIQKKYINGFIQYVYEPTDQPQ